MKRPFYLLLAVSLLAPAFPTLAQTLLLKDGSTVQTLGIRRDGDSVAAKVKTPNGEGEIGYPVGTIVRIDFPDPAQRKQATDLLAQNKPEDALKTLAPVLAYYAPFRDLPGSWWTPLAFLQLDALSRLGRDREVDALSVDLSRVGAANPAILRAVKLRQGIALERKGNHAGAIAALDPILKDEDSPPQDTAEGWIAYGAAQLALRKYEPALLAYLHIPVYTPDRTGLMPAALLGSGIAYVGIDDRPRAESTFKDLIARFPNSPEAANAKSRLEKLNGPQADKANANG